MILTTSRKPGKKTRRFARVLAKFMNWTYLNRGRMSMEDLLSFSKLALIEEIKGNPSVLKIYQKNKEILRIRFNVSNIKKIKIDNSPVFFVGKPPFDPIALDAVPCTKAGAKLFRKIAKKKIFVKSKDRNKFLVFKYKNDELFRMKLLNLNVGKC